MILLITTPVFIIQSPSGAWDSVLTPASHTLRCAPLSNTSQILWVGARSKLRLRSALSAVMSGTAFLIFSARTVCMLRNISLHAYRKCSANPYCAIA